MVAAKLANMKSGDNSKSANWLITSVPQEQAVELLNVADRSFRSAKRLMEEAAPELVVAFETGAVSVCR